MFQELKQLISQNKEVKQLTQQNQELYEEIIKLQKTLADACTRIQLLENRPVHDSSPLPPHTSPNPVPATLPNLDHSTSKPRTSYADALKRNHIPSTDKSKFIHAMATLQRRKLPTGFPTPVDLKHKVRRIYLSNLPQLPIRELKNHLFTVRFCLSRILNISYVGRSIVEFTVHEDYEHAFKNRAKNLDLPILEKYHPGTVQDKTPLPLRPKRFKMHSNLESPNYPKGLAMKL